MIFRQENKRISRKTIGFSKKIKCLINRMVLYCTHFNFCREHAGSKYQDEKGIKCKNTSARAAGITQSKWNLKELLTFRWFKTSTYKVGRTKSSDTRKILLPQFKYPITLILLFAAGLVFFYLDYHF